MVKLVVVNRSGRAVLLKFPDRDSAKRYARLLVARGLKVRSLVC